MLKFKGCGFSDTSRHRANNEDFFLVDNELGLFILCDGVGGHNSGELASRTCAEGVREVLRQSPAAIQQYAANPSREARERVGQLLQAALQAANEEIIALGKKNASNEGMATTAEVLLILNDYAVVGHVGDSRTLLIRGEAVHQLTEDHTFAVEMVRNGTWSATAAEKSPFKDNLTRAVGAQSVVHADILEIELTPGDTFLLCSDGLHRFLDAAAIQRVVAGNVPSEAAWQLVTEGNKRDARDNITAVTVKIEQAEKEATIRPADARRKQQVIGKVPLFMYLGFTELNKVLALSRVRNLNAGEVLCREGDNPEEMFVIISGKATVKKGDQTIANLDPGASVGEMGILDSLPRSATVEAAAPMSVIAIGKRDFVQLLKQDPALAVKILWAMGLELDRRLRSTSRDLAEARAILMKAKKSDLPFEVT